MKYAICIAKVPDDAKVKKNMTVSWVSEHKMYDCTIPGTVVDKDEAAAIVAAHFREEGDDEVSSGSGSGDDGE